MNRNQLLTLFDNHGISYRATESSPEINLTCPKCGPRYANRRRTLYLNSATGSWICFRCEPRNAGRNLATLFKLLRLPYSPQQTAIDDNIWRRLFNRPDATKSASSIIELPSEYRTDWSATLIGRAIWRYLTARVPSIALHRAAVGYAARGKLSGCAIFPVVAAQHRFWQARTVLFPRATKYISPPNAPKSAALYGYDRIDNRHVTIVEGIIDSLCTPNSVALLGKTISDDQIALLLKLRASAVTVMLDGDAWSAARTVAHQLRCCLDSTTYYIAAARLPAGHDPATCNTPIETLVFRDNR